MPADRVFYDGNCGFCHWSVRFLLAEDRSGRLFRFAPIGGASFHAVFPVAVQATLPDSVIVYTPDGTVFTRSAAVDHILRRLGGWWRVFAFLMRPVPARLRDRLYNAFASVRTRLFRRPKESCPLLPPHLRARFDP